MKEDGVHSLKLPEGYIISKQQRKFLAAERVTGFDFKFMGEFPRLGVAWGKHISFEEYVCEEEPVIEPSIDLRFIFWRPLGRKETPKGWFHFFLNTDLITRTGFTEIKNPNEYWKNWDSDARRLRGIFLANPKLEVVETTIDKYLSHYPNEGKYKAFRARVLNKIKRYSEVFGPDHHFYEIIERSTGKTRAGLSVADDIERHYSFHVSGFMDRSFHDQTLGVGTINHWFNESIKRGIRFIDFDVFWKPGNPKRWKGFSDFKKKFGVQFIDYPRTVMKVVWPKKVS